MPTRLRWFTDPACPRSWAAEPALRALIAGGAEVEYVMGGLAREFGAPPPVTEWLRAAEGGMPVDPLLWTEGPLGSSYPACMAVKAAQEQGAEPAARYLRALREGIFCHRRKLDTTEALIEEARRAGLDAERFRASLGSHAIVEAFGADLDRRREHPDAALPFAVVEGGEPGELPKPDAPPALSVGEAFDRFGTLALPELEALTGLPAPRAAAEVWGLVGEWRVKPEPVLASHLFIASGR